MNRGKLKVIAGAMTALGAVLGYLALTQGDGRTSDVCGRPIEAVPALECSRSLAVANMSLYAGAGMIFSSDNDHLLVFDNIAKTEEGAIVDWPLKVAAVSLSTGEIVDHYTLPLHVVLPSLEIRFELAPGHDAFALLCRPGTSECFSDGTNGRVFGAEPSLAPEPVTHHLEDYEQSFFEGGLLQSLSSQQPLGLTGTVSMDWRARDYILRVSQDGRETEIDLSPAFEGFCAAFPHPTPRNSYHHMTRVLPDPQQERVAVGVSCSRPDDAELGARIVIVDLETGAVISGVSDLFVGTVPAMAWSADGQELAVLVRSFGPMATNAAVFVLGDSDD